MDKINLLQKLSLINDHWNPRIVGELNGQYLKLVKFKGPFTWHHHEAEDEMFLVVKGRFRMELREGDKAAQVSAMFGWRKASSSSLSEERSIARWPRKNATFSSLNRQQHLIPAM